MEHHPEHWGRSRFDHIIQTQKPIAHTQQPIVTGTSVLAIKYKDGIMMAADCLASYGSLARFRDMERLVALGSTTLMGTSGDISDFQFTVNVLKQYRIEELCQNDGHTMNPRQWFTALSAYMYQRRSKMDPLWNANVVAGVDEKTGEKFLGCVDLLGTKFEASTIATGYGAYLAQPILREAVEGREDQLTEEEAKKILETCMMVLWYRDARSTDEIRLAKVTSSGVAISNPYQVKQDWSVANYKFQ